jgi:diguanylate cyclase (GGDEF)-like protein
VAVCFGDLDGFKAVNDRHGHDAGDRLLCEVASRLQGVIRSNDTAARLGGDEFVLVLTQLASPEEVHLILARARQAVAQPVMLPDGQQAAVTISFGVAFAPDMGTDAHRLLDTADRAMYVAKGAFKSRQILQQAGS